MYTCPTYDFISQKTQQRFDEAQNALALAQKRFQVRLASVKMTGRNLILSSLQDFQIELKQNQDAFKAGIEAWKEEQVRGIADILE